VALLLRPDRVFDGIQLHEGWAVLVRGERIVAAGAAASLEKPPDARVLELPGATLLPGLIEGHSHLFLHPYDETSWTDQVLGESLAERTARAVVHAEASLLAGVTTMRDLGTEGAGYADAGLKAAIEKGIIPGPRLIVTTRAIVATGAYGPRGAPEHRLPKGAEVADEADLVRVTRDQIGRGADWIKIYADYQWGPNGEARPTFTQEELALVVRVAGSSGRPVVAHASTAEGMRRATLAGVRTIEHGDGGTSEVFALMAERGVALCPTLAAGEATALYAGWHKGTDAEPPRIRAKRESFRLALEAGVPICFGGDVGVYTHGDNVRELVLMVDYGMSPLEALRAATSGNARIFDLGALGHIKPGRIADLIAVPGDPTLDISRLRQVELVIKGGKIVKGPGTAF
jgi:imidazolonepropionase-like amidohydrolase